MIFEDAHWADPTSLEAFGRVIDRIARLPVLLLLTFRSEFTPPWIGQPQSRPFRAPIRGHILLFEPLQSPSFRPDPQSLKAVARRAGQEWPSR